MPRLLSAFHSFSDCVGAGVTAVPGGMRQIATKPRLHYLDEHQREVNDHYSGNRQRRYL